MNLTCTVHQVLQFFSFKLGTKKKGQCSLPFRLPVIPFSSVTSSLQPSDCPSWVLLSPWMYRIRRHRQQGLREKTKQNRRLVLSLFPITHAPLTQLFPLTLPSVASSFLHSSQLRPTFHFRHSHPFLLHHVPPCSLTGSYTVLGNDHV